MTDLEKQAIFRRLKKLKGLVQEHAPAVRDTVRETVDHVRQAPAGRSRIDEVDAAVLQAIRSAPSEAKAGLGAQNIAQQTISGFMEDPAELQRLLEKSQGSVGNSGLQMFLTGQTPGKQLTPWEMGQLRWKTSAWQQGYDAFMKAAGLSPKVLAGAGLGAAGLMGLRKVMTDQGRVPALASSFTNDPVEYITGYKKPGMTHRAISRMATGRSLVDRARDPSDYAVSGFGGALAGGGLAAAAPAMKDFGAKALKAVF
jgi:hypothetical protein